jgi:outer membrane biogenesis lipoprotein LolB
MKTRLRHLRGWFLLLLALAPLVLAGCASTESENASARPWNSPKGWEHGLPSGMTEGR